jgi:O-antigen ligase
MALAQSYGPLCVLLLPLSIYSLFRKPKRNYLISITFIITSLAILFTFTRGVWMSLVIATLIGSFIFSKRIGIITILILLIAGCTLMVSWPKFRERTIQVFDTQKSYDSERLVLWKTNWSIFKESPLIGIGYGENKRRLREYFNRLGLPQNQFEGHAHNQYLHFLAGTGIIGLFFYLAWCFNFLKITLQLYNQSKEKENLELSLLFLGLFMAQVAFHFGSLTEANFTISKNRMLMVFIWSFVLYRYLKLKKHIEDNSSLTI